MKLLQLGTIFRPLEREGSKNVSKKGIVLIVKIFSLEVSKSKKKELEFSILPKNNPNTRKNYPWSSCNFFHVFHSFVGRIENSKNCFLDLLTFSAKI